MVSIRVEVCRDVRACSLVRKGKSKAVPLQAWSGPQGFRKLRFRDYMTTAQSGAKVVNLTHRPPLPPRKCSWYSFLLEAESTPVRSEGFCQWKIPMTPSRIEPATFRFVSQHLNHCATAVAMLYVRTIISEERIYITRGVTSQQNTVFTSS